MCPTSVQALRRYAQYLLEVRQAAKFPLLLRCVPALTFTQDVRVPHFVRVNRSVTISTRVISC